MRLECPNERLCKSKAVECTRLARSTAHKHGEGCQLACALLNGRAAAYDRRASFSFRKKARGRPKLSSLTSTG